MRMRFVIIFTGRFEDFLFFIFPVYVIIRIVLKK